MSYHRTITAQERADGITVADRTVEIEGRRRYLCRLCGVLCPGRRASYCSNACAREWLIRADPRFMREALFERDRGVCALCGFDTVPIAEALWAVRDWPEVARGAAEALGWARSDVVSRKVVFSDHRGRRERISAVVLWHADHVVPVVEGGGACGLDNLRTLCAPCHRAVTGEQNRRRARDGRLRPASGDELRTP